MNSSVLLKYPPAKRLFKSSDADFEGWRPGSCIFGMAHQDDPLPSIETIPPDTRAFYSFFAEASRDILEYLVELGINEKLEYLTIGFEHGNMEYGYKDYSRISELLSTANFPALRYFEYGSDFLLVNEEQYYPHLGNITGVLKNMPLLETLDISGSFELREKVVLSEMKEIYMTDYYSKTTNGTIDDRTLEHLLGSDFGKLQVLEIYPEADEDHVYNFNDDIIKKNTDTLKFVAIGGKFEKGTKERIGLLNLKTGTIDLDDLEEDIIV